MKYYLANRSTDTDKTINDIGLLVPYSGYIVIDSNDINGWMLDSSDLYNAIQAGVSTPGTGDKGLTLWDDDPDGAGEVYTTAAATKRLSLSKDGDLVIFDNSVANLAGSPTTIQAAIEALDDRVDNLSGTNWKQHVEYRVLEIGGGDTTSGYQEWGFSDATTTGSASGLANDSTTYTCSISVDGVANPISIVGSDSQTIGDVIDEINADLTGATCSFNATGNGFIKITSDSDGTASTIAITDTDLFSSLTNANGSAESAVAGTNPSAPSTPVEGDFWVDTTKNPDEYKRYDGSDWVFEGTVIDSDRVIKLDDTAGTYYQRIFVYEDSGHTWSAVENNEDNAACIVNDDGDDQAAMYVFDTAADSGNGAWIKTADIDWGSPTLQSVYDSGDSTVTMSGGGGDVVWSLHDTGKWEVNNGSLYVRVVRSGADMNWLVHSSLIDWEAATIDLDSTGGTDFADDGGAHIELAAAGGITVESTTSTAAVKGVSTADLQATGGDANAKARILSNGTGTDAISIQASGTGGDIDIDANDAITIDAGGAISIDAAGASNISVAGATLTIETTSSGDIDINSAANVTVDGTGISIDGTAASNLSTTSADLTISTITSGILNLTSAGNMDITIGGTLNWNDGTNTWTPQHEGLRLKSYTTGSLPDPPGVTSNYGAIAFDTTRDIPVVWVSDSDGGGTDGWVRILTEEYDTTETLNEAYDAYGGTAGTPVLALVTVDAGNVEWRLTPTVTTFDPAKFLIGDGTNNFFEVGSATDGDDYINIKSRNDSDSQTGTGITINDYNVQAGGTGGGISITTTKLAGTAGNITINSANAIDIDATNGITIDGTAISIDGTAASNFTVDSANLTLSTTTSGNVVLNAVGNIDGDAVNITLDASSGFSIDGNAASNVTTTGANVTLSTLTSGNVVINSVDDLDVDASNMTFDATGGVSIDAAAASNITVDDANLTIETTTSGDVDINSAANVTVDATSAISLDAAAASNFTVASANLTLSTTTSGDVIANAAGNVDVDGVNVTIDASSAFSIDGAAASNVTVTGGNLTLSTVTSGDIKVTAVDGIEFTAADGTILWTDGTNIWTPQHEGLRLKNYATGSLPTPPGVTGNYGAIAFDTTLDAPVVWVSDSDGGGTDGWLQLRTAADDLTETLDESYNNYGATAAIITIDNGEGQGDLIFRLAADTDSFKIDDGTNTICEFTRDSTAGAADGRVDVGDNAILGLPAKSAAPTASNAAGDLFYDTDDGLCYVYDGTRSKFLTTTRMHLTFGAANADGRYLRISGAQAAQTGYRMPKDGTITSVTIIGASGNATKAFEIRRNNNSVAPLKSFSLSSTVYTDAAVNVNFDATDYIQVFASPVGTAVNNVVAIIEVAFRQ